MVHYRRVFLKGGTYFFTVNLKNRQSSLLIDAVDLLRESFLYTQNKKPFTIIAIVILPEHLHCIWQLPESDKDYPARWKSIKSHFTRQIKKSGMHIKQNNHHEHNIWQRRYWEHTIRDDNDLTQHIDYIHYNPVKHGWVKSVKDWEYSSFHKYVKNGTLPLNWGSNIESNDLIGYGERSLDAATRNQGISNNNLDSTSLHQGYLNE